MEQGRLKRAYIVICLLLAASAGVLLLKPPKTVNDNSFRKLPDQLGLWNKTEDIKFQDRVINILGTDEVVSNIYVSPENKKIQVTFVHAVNNRSAFHPPEYCLTGGGSRIIGKEIQNCAIDDPRIKNIAVNEMIFDSVPGKKLFVWTWYAAEKQCTPNFYKQQASLVWNGIVKGKSAGSVINLYIYLSNDDIESARAAAAGFAKALMPFLYDYL
jgi:EpsI family protein